MNENFFKTNIAYENWVSKYQYNNETPLGTFQRIAKTLASNEKNPEQWEDIFLKTLLKFQNNEPVGIKCSPGGRITSNIGTGYNGATLINCFISGPVKNANITYTRKNKNFESTTTITSPDTGDDLVNIFLTILEQAKTLASEGGWGINFDFIRPRGSLIKGTGVGHPGVVSYMEIFDAVSECIVKGHKDGYEDTLKNHLSKEEIEQCEKILKKMPRKGACMGILSVNHPDIEEFVRVKQQSGKLTKFNLSAAITNDFMECVEKNEIWDLKWEGKTIKRVKAKDLYELIMKSTYNRAEPGVIFVDNISENNPIEYLGKCNATNPCLVGESLVQTNKGYIEIKDLVERFEKGEDFEIVSFNFEKNKKEFKKLQNAFLTKRNAEVVELFFENTIALRCTPDHEVFTKDRGKVQAKELQLSDRIYVEDGLTVMVQIAELKGTFDVFDITVEDNHNFYANGVLVSNCGEIPGNPDMTTVCLLGSINLTQYVYINDGVSYFDWDTYKQDIRVFTRMLDNVCDLSKLPLPSYEWAVQNLRQFGMGVNGLGSTLLMLGIPYNSAAAITFTKTIHELKENLTMQESSILAKEKGAFNLYDYDLFSKTKYFKSDRLWKETKELIKQYGVRNAKTSTAPPLGNSAIICDYVSNGIEPIFSLETERKVICNWPDGLNSSNIKKLFKEIKKKDFVYWEGEYNGKRYYYEPHNRGICEIHILRDYGYQWLLDNKPYEKINTKITANDIDIIDHLNIQTMCQYYCNQSVSKTINLPNKYSFSNFKNLYIDAWKRGLVGVTTYRDGSMESVLGRLEEAEEKKEIIKDGVKMPSEFINGLSKVIKKEGMKFYIHFSYLKEDVNMKYPVAMWIYTNQKGEAISCNRACKSLSKLALECGLKNKLIDDTWDKCLGDSPHNRLGRMISLCLRHNIPREDILVSLTGIEGDHISTLLTAVRKFLAETIDDGKEIVGMKCPSCGSDRLIMQSGCFTCECGYAGCGA